MSEVPAGYWPCACVKRDRKGRMSHIGMVPPDKKNCPKCGAKKPEAA